MVHTVWGQQIHNLFDALCNSRADFIRPPVTISKAFKLICLIALKDRKIGNEVVLQKIKACDSNVMQINLLQTIRLFLVTDSLVMQPNEQLSWSKTSHVLVFALFYLLPKTPHFDASNDHENNLSLYLPPLIIEWGAFRVSRGQECFCFQGAGFCMAHPLSERLKELLQWENTYTFSHTAVVLCWFCFRTQILQWTSSGANIVYHIIILNFLQLLKLYIQHIVFA